MASIFPGLSHADRHRRAPHPLTLHIMMSGWFRPRAPWQGMDGVDKQHTLAVERALAAVRLTLVVVSFIVAVAERNRPHWHLLVAVLGALAIYSILAAAAIRRGRFRAPGDVVTFHVIDTAAVLLVIVITGGVLGPFSTLFLFALLAAGYRWGLYETALTCAAGVLVLALHAGIAYVLADSGEGPDGHIVALRVAYMTLGTVLIGSIAETERLHRYRALSVSRILTRVRSEAGLVAAVQAVLDELLTQFRASHAVLVLEEEGHLPVSLWQAERSPESRRARIRLNHERRDDRATYLFPVPPAADAWQVRQDGSGTSVLALDANGARITQPFDVTPLLRTPFGWRTAFCLSSIVGEGWKGRVFLFLDGPAPAARAQLGYLQVVVRHVAPALFNLYLQRRLQSRTGVVERARISRELHDGVIQSLIGVEMQLEVLRREAAAALPASTSSQLVNIQRILSQEILNVRDLMHLLRPAEVDAKRLVEHLADTVERFRQRTGIQARFSCDVDEIELSPRVCRELAAVVQEALANVRKHSGASTVMVRLGRCNGTWQLVVDDNGRGLDFEGHLTHEEVDARRKGPMIIKERVRSIGGRLSLASHPGFGTRLEITIPGKHHA